jgi:tRNA pseudouridine32 synthase/23S rRNA pseudouridine746 synthase
LKKARTVRAPRAAVNTAMPDASCRRRSGRGGKPARSRRKLAAVTVTPLWLDPHLIAVDKPSGLLAVPGRTEPDSLFTRVVRQWSDALVVHRIDQPTSGLLLFARGGAMQRVLSAAFAERRVHKGYVAVVHGDVAGDAGEITLPLAADWPNRPRQQVDHERGRPATTRWHVVSRDPRAGTTRLALEPLTGRSHQLRVHLLAIGHPIVGDRLYAAPDNAPRLLLHAEQLALAHPYDARPIGVRAPVPF